MTLGECTPGDVVEFEHDGDRFRGQVSFQDPKKPPYRVTFVNLERYRRPDSWRNPVSFPARVTVAKRKAYQPGAPMASGGDADPLLTGR